MGNVSSLIPLGVDTCTHASKCGNDQASAAAILIITLTTGVAGLWQLIAMLPFVHGISDDGALGLLLVGIGVAFSISTCYPQQITAGAYTNALCGALVMYDLVIVNTWTDYINGLPNIIAVALNATVVWYAAISQESIHPKGLYVWGGFTGDPKVVTTIMVVAVGIAILCSLITGGVQVRGGHLDSMTEIQAGIEMKKCRSEVIALPTADKRTTAKQSNMVRTRYILVHLTNALLAIIMIIMGIVHTVKVWSLFASGPNNIDLGCDYMYSDASNNVYVSHEGYYKAYPIIQIMSMCVNLWNAGLYVYLAICRFDSLTK